MNIAFALAMRLYASPLDRPIFSLKAGDVGGAFGKGERRRVVEKHAQLRETSNNLVHELGGVAQRTLVSVCIGDQCNNASDTSVLQANKCANRCGLPASLAQSLEAVVPVAHVGAFAYRRPPVHPPQPKKEEPTQK